MKLLKAQITNYRSVEDSTEFSIDQLTCLVGKNESGKTNILNALYKLNPYESEANEFDKDSDYPRRFLTDYDERHGDDDAIVVNSTWELLDQDIKAISEKLPEIKLKSRQIIIKKGYGKSRIWDIQIDQNALVTNLFNTSGLTAEEQQSLSKPTTLAKLTTALAELSDPTERQKILQKDILSRFEKGAIIAVASVLTQQMPKFVLFSQYDTMKGRVSLDEIKKKLSQNPVALNSQDRVFMSFLGQAKVSVEELDKIDTFESLKARLEAVSIKITEKIFQYWSQNPYLEVQFTLDQGLSGDTAPFNQGRIMSTRIYNKLHKMSVPFDMRSAGFVWFYSFLVYFSQVKKNFKGDVIVLLDEPGMTLHAKAQEDLLIYMKEELMENHQLIYTTHSPFMIDPDNMDSVRSVEDKIIKNPNGRPEIEVLGTKIGEKQALSTDRDTLFPLQGILGYGITQTLFIGRYTVLVEGMSDLLFLRVFSDYLKSKGKSGLNSKWTLCPVGGVTKVQSFVSLFHGNGLQFASVVDYATGEKKKVEELRVQVAALKTGSVHSLNDYSAKPEADIEDLLGTPTYIELIVHAYNIQGDDRKKLEQGTSERVVKKVEEGFRLLDAKRYPEFDHFTPAQYLAENRDIIEKLPEFEKALKRFEKLFSDIG